MDSEEMKLLNWRFQLFRKRPEIMPEMEMIGEKVRVICKDELIAQMAFVLFPKDVIRYRVSIFVGKEKEPYHDNYKWWYLD